MNGASRFTVRRCFAIATAAAIALIAVTLVLAAPASATDPHDEGAHANQAATSPSRQPREGAAASSQGSERDGVDDVGKVATDPSVGEPATTAQPDTAEPGHDKCKRRKGNRPLLPWCTDPAAGWTASTTHRVENIPPDPRGICDASHPSSRCSPVRTDAA
jgi:hypothetical protein